MVADPSGVWELELSTFQVVFISFSSQVALEIKVINSPAASQSSQSSL